jgi:hypothetical protein
VVKIGLDKSSLQGLLITRCFTAERCAYMQCIALWLDLRAMIRRKWQQSFWQLGLIRLLHGSQIHALHHQTTREHVTYVVPAKILDISFFKRQLEPRPWHLTLKSTLLEIMRH